MLSNTCSRLLFAEFGVVLSIRTKMSLMIPCEVALLKHRVRLVFKQHQGCRLVSHLVFLGFACELVLVACGVLCFFAARRNAKSTLGRMASLLLQKTLRNQ